MGLSFFAPVLSVNNYGATLHFPCKMSFLSHGSCLVSVYSTTRTCVITRYSHNVLASATCMRVTIEYWYRVSFFLQIRIANGFNFVGRIQICYFWCLRGRTCKGQATVLSCLLRVREGEWSTTELIR